MWTTEYIISQIFAFLAFTCLGITFLIKNKKTILILNIIAAAFYATQYLLVYAYVGAISNFLSAIAMIWYFLNEKFNRKNDYVSISVVSALCIAFTIVTYQHWIDVLILLATLAFTFGAWQQNNKIYRWIGLFVGVFWMVYNSFHILIVQLVIDVISLSIRILGVIKLYMRKKDSNKNNEQKNSV